MPLCGSEAYTCKDAWKRQQKEHGVAKGWESVHRSFEFPQSDGRPVSWRQGTGVVAKSAFEERKTAAETLEDCFLWVHTHITPKPL
jgi:hypothetical protein